SLHCSVDEIMIARLILVDVVLADQLQGFCENGNLRVAVILFGLRRLHFLRESAGNSAEQDASQQRNNQDPPPLSPTSEKDITIAHEQILATSNPQACL